MSTPPTLCLFAGSNGAGKADVRRRFARSQTNLIQLYGPLADTWQVWDRNDRLQRRFEAAVSPVSAITQSAPPDNHLLEFKVHHLRM